MKPFMIAGIVLFVVPVAAHAQSDPNCMARASIARDICLRDARAGGYSDRNCYANYISATTSCRRTIVRPRPAPQRRDPRVSPVKPVKPRVNP
jgi:hypothetical protein